MREKHVLFAIITLLCASATRALFVGTSIAELPKTASADNHFVASLQSIGIPKPSPVKTLDHAVAPIRRVLVEHARKREQEKQQEVIREEQKGQTPFEDPPKRPRTIPAIHPAIDKVDIDIKHRLIADEVVKLLPQNCQNKLRNFYVQYNNMDGRGLGGKSTIIVNGDVPDHEFRALFIHELGHVIDLGCQHGSPHARGTQYRDGNEIMLEDDPSIDFYKISWLSSHTQRQRSESEDFVSGYASWDMFEDFAESFVYFVLHRSEFAMRAQQNNALAAKYAWFQKHLATLPQVAISNHEWNGDIPWDITKLSYTWTANEQVAQKTK